MRAGQQGNARAVEGEAREQLDAAADGVTGDPDGPEIDLSHISTIDEKWTGKP
ncbi:hypothetical protein GCM10017567_40740 [Amycolatopsis bullii]|uniref:Antitoxin n=1 Tax=Amycolatopsis bullii TaxID=941987 RepID=A0ABQ3KEP9_9PSEU|nr:hypothetical protein GCM10017567_40740 [Amycolatopsis bullii]